MERLKIQKLEYLENGTQIFYEIKKFLTCAGLWHDARAIVHARPVILAKQRKGDSGGR